MDDSDSTLRFCKKCQAETERNKRGYCKTCQKAYNDAYYAANHKKVKASTAAWAAANPERKKAIDAAWHKANPEKTKVAIATWQAANAERFKATNAAYRAANPEKVFAACKAWAKAHPEARRVYYQNYQAKKRANGGTLSKGLSAKLFKLQKGKCACCGQPLGTNYHLDHIMPIVLGGPNIDSNIQLLRQHCNNQKASKHPVDFMQQRGYLL